MQISPLRSKVMSRPHLASRRQFRFLFVGIVILGSVYFFSHSLWVYFICLLDYFPAEEIDFTKHDNITGFDYMIVPNIVHFFRFRNHSLTFTDMVSILSAWCHQRPEKIIIHCDCDDLEGYHWEKIRHLEGMEVHRMKEPRAVFGRALSSVYHSGDVARIAVLMKYGGIALDLDSYVVRSLDEFRKFEMSLGWHAGENLGTQVLVAHKKARFLDKWLDSYKFYRPGDWYYNAGELPTRLLEREVHLVHRVPDLFGVHMLIAQLYKTKVWRDWHTFYTIHLLIRHRSYLDKESKIQNFDENNIRDYPFAYGEMARLVVYGTTDFVPMNSGNNWTLDQCRTQLRFDTELE